ncbi:hypothetical protein SCP_0806310 [Sparassis crispa]|uniref:Uncharacterized protein n=1 Tax=Sparassis crispa TaxID=139825 RepID=A0A401GV41_9APHY|nr:hypothetical protein SCP_0806310 [Sparassis crispa]GBE86107.1 hypothetical protein SCP_0806310 [Sparassis crispa]
MSAREKNQSIPPETFAAGQVLRLAQYDVPGKIFSGHLPARPAVLGRIGLLTQVTGDETYEESVAFAKLVLQNQCAVSSEIRMFVAQLWQHQEKCAQKKRICRLSKTGPPVSYEVLCLRACKTIFMDASSILSLLGGHSFHRDYRRGPAPARHTQRLEVHSEEQAHLHRRRIDASIALRTHAGACDNGASSINHVNLVLDKNNCRRFNTRGDLYLAAVFQDSFRQLALWYGRGSIDSSLYTLPHRIPNPLH